MRTRQGNLAVLTFLLIGGATVAFLLGWSDVAVFLVALTSAVLALVVLDVHRRQAAVPTMIRASLKGVESDLSRLGEAVQAVSRRMSEIEAVQRDIRLIQRDILGAQFVSEERSSTRLDRLAEETRTMNAELRRIRTDQKGKLESLERSLFSEVLSEVDGLLQLHARFELDARRPLVGGWAMAPRGIVQLLDLIETDRPRLIAECGPGTTTVYAAACLRALGLSESRIVALEHDPVFSERVRWYLDKLELSAFVDVRDAPLVEWQIEGETFQWYDPRSLDDLSDIDLLVIDGPPEGTGPLARYPALSAFRDRLRPGAAVLLDDARRPDESEIIGRWVETGSLLQEQGLSRRQAVFRFQDQG